MLRKNLGSEPRLQGLLLVTCAAAWGLLLSSLTGCGIGPADTTANVSAHFAGVVHGGQNGVSGSSIKLYVAGNTGLGSAATSVLVTPVTTDASGFFSITNDYHCTNATDQMFISATGGDPGFGMSNPALVMLAALGDCGNLPTTSYITINEVTTVAAAWALGQFATDATHLGASSTNAVGLRNAFLDSQLIASSVTGATPVLPANLSTETGKIYALADAIAPCINSTGGAGPCAALFAAATPSGRSAPSNSFNAALNIVHNPGNNVATIFGLINADAPFPTTLSSAPHEWTLGLTVTGGGLANPTGLGLDAQGNVWVADYAGLLSGFSPQGTPLSATGFGSGHLVDVFGLAVDNSGNIWMTDYDAPNHVPTKGGLTKLQGAGAPDTTTNPGVTPALGDFITLVSSTALSYPASVAADTNGYISVGNYLDGSAAIFDASGNLVVGPIGANAGQAPEAIALDANHGIWLANYGSPSVTHIAFTNPSNIPASATTITAVSGCCSGASGISVDALGNAWVGNYSNASFSEISSSNAILISKQTFAGASAPSAVFIDGAQNVWLANYHGNTVSKLSGSNTSTPGKLLSPNPAYGSDLLISQPYALQGDRSGNLWITNQSMNNLVMLFGMAAPTVTPLHPVPALP